MLGYTVAELQPTTFDTWGQLLHPDDLVHARAALDVHFSGQADYYDVEVRMRRKDGGYGWVHTRGQVVARDDDGTPRRMVGTHDDIDERVVASQRLAASERRLASLFEGHAAPMALINPSDATLVDVNPAGAAFLSLSREEAAGLPVSDFYDDTPEHLRQLMDDASREPQGHYVVTLRLRDGSTRSVELQSSPIIDDDGIIRIFAILTDVTEREQHDRLLREAAAVFDNVSEAIVISGANGLVRRVNPAFTALTGRGIEEVAGTHAAELVPTPPAAVIADAWAQYEQSGTIRSEVMVRRADGTEIPALVTVTPVREPDGAISAHIAVVTDISEHVRAEQEQLDRAVTDDPLTGLPNRRGFTSSLGGRLGHRRRNESTSALLVIDIDRFKDINDSFGHAAGDELLREISDRLGAIIRADDLLARLGSDEFALYAHRVRSGDAADELARRVQGAIAPAVAVGDGSEVFVTACVGVCVVGKGTDDANDVVQRAMAAVSDAKRVGPGSIRHHDDALTTVSRARLHLETRLRKAWDERQLVVHYQPQLTVTGERIVGAEALLRWPSSDGMSVPASLVVSVAEKIGLIPDIGAWVLEEACRQGQAWRDAGLPDLTIAVNVSARQLDQGTFHDQVAAVLDRTGLPARLLELELTESALLETGDRTQSLLEALSSLGVRLSIDDFGTGYSSFAYLRRFPLHQLKVDRAFVADLATDAEDRAITSAIVGLGHTLGLSVLAEGVESPAILDILRDLQCDQFQGYLASPAVTAEAFADLVRADT